LALWEFSGDTTLEPISSLTRFKSFPIFILETCKGLLSFPGEDGSSGFFFLFFLSNFLVAFYSFSINAGYFMRSSIKLGSKYPYKASAA
jgi:hypothetical protein